MRTITATELIDEVKEILYSYYEKDLIDDSLLIKKLSRLTSNFRRDHFPVKSILLTISNGIATLPDDVNKIRLMKVCTQQTKQVLNPQTTYTDREEYVANHCSTDCSDCDVMAYIDDCGDKFHVIRKYHNYQETFVNFQWVGISNNLKSQHSCCINHKGHNVDIQGNKLYFDSNIIEGVVYIEYYPKFESATEINFPYHPKIKQWLIDEVMVHALKLMYYNGEEVSQKLGLAQNDLKISEITAKSILKTPEVIDVYCLSNKIISKYNFHRNAVQVPSQLRGARYGRKFY